MVFDGALVDLYKLPHGYWEAKDEKDDLAKEVERKLDKGFTTVASTAIPELHFAASTDGFQCFPFYTYTEDGTHRRENITD